jgi:glycosyltransferase involved in cell wall biosynthesis
MKKTKKLVVINPGAWDKNIKSIPNPIHLIQDYIEKEGNINIEIIQIQPVRKLGFFFGYVIPFLKLLLELLKKDFDILFVTNMYYSPICAIGKLRGKKSVAFYTDIYPNFLMKERKSFFRFAALQVWSKIISSMADRIIIPSEIEKDIAGILGIDKRKIEVIRHPVDSVLMKFDEKSRDRIRKRYGIEKKFVIGYVGRLIEHYRIDNVIKTVSLLKERDKLVFLLIGEGPVKEKLVQLADELGVKLIDIGFVPHDEINEYYSSFDLFIYPINGTGIKFCELMMIGIPILAPSGMPEEFITNGKTGFIAKDDSPESFAEKVEQIMKIDEKSMKKIKQDMRRFANENFEIKAVFLKFKKVFEG